MKNPPSNSLAESANAPECVAGGMTVKFSEYDQATERDGGVVLRANNAHQARGVVFFFPREVSGPIKDALGIEYVKDLLPELVSPPEAGESHQDQPIG